MNIYICTTERIKNARKKSNKRHKRKNNTTSDKNMTVLIWLLSFGKRQHIHVFHVSRTGKPRQIQCVTV